MPAEAVTSIVFDFGGVLYDIDFVRTRKAFAELGVPHFADVWQGYSQADVFNQFEVGAVDADTFRKDVTRLLKRGAKTEAQKRALDALDAQTFNRAFCQLLVGMPKARLAWLVALKKKMPIYLLSNTNSIHLAHLEKDVKGLRSLFCRAYFSHELHARKPDALAYTEVLQKNGLAPKSTLFVDDHVPNLKGAQAVGMQALHVSSDKDVQDHLRAYQPHLSA